MMRVLVFCFVLILAAFSTQSVAAHFPPPNDAYNCYSTQPEINARGEALARLDPTMVAWESIGKGSAGTGFFVLRFGSRNTTAPQFFVVSGLDANDLTSGQMNLAFAEYLLSSTEARPLLDLVQFHLVFSANPDGRAHVDALLLQGGQVDWLGNTNTISCPDGVRLDFNFATNRFDTSYCGQEYAGESRLSELETQALDTYIRSFMGSPSPIGSTAPLRPQGFLINLNGNSSGWSYPLKPDGSLYLPADGLPQLAGKLAYLVNNPVRPQIDPPNTVYKPGTLIQAAYERYGLSGLTLRMHFGTTTPPLPLPCGSASEMYSGLKADYTKALFQAALASLSPVDAARGPEITMQALTKIADGFLLQAQANAYFDDLALQPISHIEFAFADAAGKIPPPPWQKMDQISAPDVNMFHEAEKQIQSIPPGAKYIYLRAVNIDDQAGIMQVLYVPSQALPPIQVGFKVHLPILYR